MGEERKEVKKPTLFTAVLPLIFMFVVLLQDWLFIVLILRFF